MLSPDGQHVLMEAHTLTVLPSASSLQFILQNAQQTGGTPLVLGNPQVDYEPLAALAAAAQSAQTISNMWGTTPLIGAAATEATVREQAAQSSFLHLAAHGSYNIANPLYSTIYLAAGAGQDGRLETHEVYSLNLQQSDMVVLSSCETLLSRDIDQARRVVSAGDDIVGLSRAFFYAGTPTVIASLWQVDDVATTSLMERFYTHYQAGMSKMEALRQAQLETRQEYPHFRNWAPFVLSGDGGMLSNALPTSTPASQPTETPPTSSESAQTRSPTSERCFAETGFCIGGAIRNYWEQNGGLEVFGYPTGAQHEAVIEEQPYQVQVFERTRLEVHPENAPPYDVLLGRLGAERVEAALADGSLTLPAPEEPRSGDCHYFAETGWNVCGSILQRYRSGGLETDGQAGYSLADNMALFGLPLTPLVTMELEGQQYQVQWFERARFELHPENPPPYDVLLGLLGNEVFGE
jgi:hypothetical protein